MISAACRKRINCDQHCHKSSDLPLMIHETIINIENLERCQLGEHDEPKRTVQSEEKDSEVEEVMGSAASETSPTQAEILVPTSSCDSPYPTPLILVDGMQTPGTIYPPKAENIRIGKIRSQFIYPVEDFCQNSFKSKVACENSNFVQSNIRMKGEPPFDVSEIEAAMDVTQEPICSGVICDIERAVIGVVVAQRNEDKTSCVSSKQWVGNGFPNSTSKYKEDQKVSWHATPFEVRLDKVLSDEKLHQQRRTGGRMIELEGKE
ncbi:hypothetical protein AXF42_Ash008280 [Apostasia shenzhenica]|uniref:Uncharacterized protein n=1 Tax=Apostasia shenzhenica TaxID=1088818 RepID=A0A2I0AXE8_9ASPA|nr:hypothetical protein AXF42_Ash008280 [Apostasia shenzhenica]